MSTITNISPLGIFNSLRRGMPAPDWIFESVTSAWSLDPDSTRISLIAVSENATFRIDVDGLPVSVLRVHRPGHVGDSRQITGELTWVRRLAEEAQVRVPDVVPTSSGHLLQTFTDPSGGTWYCVAFAFVAGDILENVPDPRPFYAEIGAIAARLHHQVQNWELPDDFLRFSWDLTDMVGLTSRWGDWRGAPLDQAQVLTLERVERVALSVLEDLPAFGDGWGLVHADLRPSNIMIDGGALTVIDFDDCGFSWLLYDFASALSFIEHKDYAPDIAKSWVAGYRTVRPLSDTDLFHAAALSMIRRLTMLGWTTTHQADALPPDLWDEQIPGTVEVAEKYLASPTWLFD